MSAQTYQLSQLTGFIRRVFALNLPEAVWVTAELAQANTSRGHCWLTLVEKDPEGEGIVAQLEGVVWASQLTDLQRHHGIKLVRELLREGMSVRLKITTSFHQRYGLRLVVEDIDPAHTLGELERRRQLTLEALSKDGLLDANANIPFPIVPQRLAVISSDTAAGLADFREQLDANPYGYRFRLQLFTAAMQGVQTSPEIQSRLRQIARRQADYDAVIIVRGGGGRTDLAAFDEEALCRAVASFPLPVIVGIGHETDDSVLDRVAHHSLKTPTATAVWLVEQFMRAEGTVVQLSRAIRETGAHHLAIERPRLAGLAGQARQLATAALRGESQRRDRAEKDLALLPGRALLNANHQLDNLEKLLSALRPETTLARGYALVSQDGKLLLNPDDITEGEVEIRLKEGRTTLLKPGESDS